MRVVLGLLVLAALFGAASYWQGTWTQGLIDERESLKTAPGNLEERESSWGTITLGRPSGADPIDLPDRPPADRLSSDQSEGLPFLFDPEAAPSPESGEIQAVPLSRPAVVQDFEFKVPEGRVLSKICEDFYGSGREPIPAKVAAYNGLKSPDALRAGVVIKLPDWNVLFPGKPRP